MTTATRIAARAAVLFALGAILSPDAARADDPPALVGRLSYMEGTVTFHAGDQTQWSYAAVNYPVTSGESFWSQPDGRSEIEIGPSAVRMDNGTEFDVLHLDATTAQFQLDQGTINYSLKSLAPGEAVEIETPHGAVSLVQPGTYHIEAGDDTHPTVVATLEGEARFIGPHSYLDIGAGEQATAIGDPVNYTMAEAATTPFDDWSLQRDQLASNGHTFTTTSAEGEAFAPGAPPQSAQYVSPQVTGYQDLGQYGAWQTVPQYGPVWIPTSVPAQWAPYHAGHWAWVAPWGWTWIDDQPWGFAPFHYGRWAQVNQQWAWVPGPVVARPVYAPALVAFIGGALAPGVNVGIGIGGGGISLAGSIGWLPLAPNEVYYPPYHPSLRYVQALNAGPVGPAQVNRITNNYVNINRTVNNYANAPAATVVPQQAFVNAQPVQRSAVAMTPQLRSAPVTASLATVKPTPVARMAALPAAMHPSGEPATAPGPSVQQQHAETQAIEHAEPKSLSTSGMPEARPATEGQPAAEQGRVAPAPGPAPAPVESAALKPAAEPQAVREEHAEAPRQVAQQGEIEPRKATPVREPGVPAPGPAITAARQPVPLRQKQLAAALAKPAAAPAAPRPQVASRAPVPQPAAAAKPAAVPVAFHPAEVEHPKQSAPLRATPAGWHRQAAEAAKPAEKPADAKDKKDER